MRGALLLIIFIAVVTFLIDMSTNKCLKKNAEAIGPLLFHHLVYTFSLLGWLLDDPVMLLIYIGLPFVVMLQWRTNGDGCFVDQVMENICGYKTQFNHIGNKLGIPTIITTGIVIFGVIIASIKLFKILRAQKNGQRPGPSCGLIPPWCFPGSCKRRECISVTGDKEKCSINGCETKMYKPPKVTKPKRIFN
jgi:hypothetical protein